MTKLLAFVVKLSRIWPHSSLKREKKSLRRAGLDVIRNDAKLKGVIDRLFGSGIEEVALFVDPEIDQIKASAETGANCIEMHTGDYAIAKTNKERIAILNKLADAAEMAHSLGLTVHAGHGLDYSNYTLFKQAVPHISEVSIGFAVVARAMFVGFERAVSEMLRVVKG